MTNRRENVDLSIDKMNSLLGEVQGVPASSGHFLGGRVTSDEDKMAKKKDIEDLSIEEAMNSPPGGIDPLLDDPSWATSLELRLNELESRKQKGSTLPKLDTTHPKTREDINKFKALLKENGIILTDQTILITELLKSFLRLVAEKLYIIAMDKHIYNRMIWLMDNNPLGQTAVLLKASVFAACVTKRREYDIEKTKRRVKKLPQRALQDLLASSMDLDWVDGIKDTEMGFKRDFGLFQELLSKNDLDLEDLEASNTCTASSCRKSFYCFLSKIAKAGYDNGMPFKMYRRMMIVICRTSSWPNELDVLKAFFMSMCKYQRGDGKYARKETERNDDDAEERSNAEGDDEVKRDEGEDSSGIVEA